MFGGYSPFGSYSQKLDQQTRIGARAQRRRSVHNSARHGQPRGEGGAEMQAGGGWSLCGLSKASSWGAFVESLSDNQQDLFSEFLASLSDQELERFKTILSANSYGAAHLS